MPARQAYLPSGISYSALSAYAECGEKYRLTKIYKLGSETWFATVAGSAIHNITQIMDLIEIEAIDPATRIPTFEEEFDRLLTEEYRKNVTVKPSGRELKNIGKTGGPNKKDHAWWLIYGPASVERWVEWKKDSGWFLITMPNGNPGIEVPFEQTVGDGIVFRGFIDRVYGNMDGDVIVTDLKSGKLPSGHLQLASYGLGLHREHGLKATHGTYWMASDGQLTSLVDLSQYSEVYVDHLYQMAWTGITSGVFVPNVTSACRGCVVRKFCRAVGGQAAMSIPVVSDLKVRPQEGGEA